MSYTHKKFIRVSGYFVSLGLPDPRREWRRMLANIAGAVLIVVLACAVVDVLAYLQEVMLP